MLVKEVDCEGLKVSIPLQPVVHAESAIQRSLRNRLFRTFPRSECNTTHDDPVSMMTL